LVVGEPLRVTDTTEEGIERARATLEDGLKQNEARARQILT